MGREDKPILIGIAGPSGSGKTGLARRLVEALWQTLRWLCRVRVKSLAPKPTIGTATTQKSYCIHRISLSNAPEGNAAGKVWRGRGVITEAGNRT